MNFNILEVLNRLQQIVEITPEHVFQSLSDQSSGGRGNCFIVLPKIDA